MSVTRWNLSDEMGLIASEAHVVLTLLKSLEPSEQFSAERQGVAEMAKVPDGKTTNILGLVRISCSICNYRRASVKMYL